MPYQSITLLQLRTRLKDRYESTAFWTDAQATDAINEALLTWGMLTGRWKRRVLLSTTARQYELALPTTMVYRMRLAWNNYPLSPTTIEGLDLGRPNWRKEAVDSGGSVPTRPTLWAPVSLMLVYIWPMDVSNHNSFLVDGVSATPTLTADGDYVDLAEADVSLLLGFALHVLTFKKGGPAFAATQPLFKAFVEAAAAENSLITTSQWYRKYMGLEDHALRRLKGQPASVSGLTSGLPYDVFIDYNGGSPTMEFVAWTNDTTRATALATLNGIYVQSGDNDSRFVGTFYTTGTTTTEDSAQNRYVSNYYNRAQRRMFIQFPSTYNYGTATWQETNNSSSYRLNVVIPVDGYATLDVETRHFAVWNTGGGAEARCGVALDSNTTPDTASAIQRSNLPNSYFQPCASTLVKTPAAGKHYFAKLEAGNGTSMEWRGVDAGVGNTGALYTVFTN